MKIKGLLKLLSAFIISIAWNNSAQAGSINSGLGPLEIRPQFIVSQPFLGMTPENSSTLIGGESRLSVGLESQILLSTLRDRLNKSQKKKWPAD